MMETIEVITDTFDPDLAFTRADGQCACRRDAVDYSWSLRLVCVKKHCTNDHVLGDKYRWVFETVKD